MPKTHLRVADRFLIWAKMDNNLFDKIVRFTDRVPEPLTDHWNEILEELDFRLDDYISQIELDNMQAMKSIHDMAQGLYSLRRVVESGIIVKRSLIIEYIDAIIERSAYGIKEYYENKERRVFDA